MFMRAASLSKTEFRHHMESRAGLRDLEIADRMQMEDYENQKK